MNALTTQSLYQRVSELSEAQRVALAQRLSASTSVPQKSQAPARLVAYVVPELPGVLLDGTVLRDALKSALPAHMVPAVIVPLAALPRTANGKVDVKALPDPQSVVSAAATTGSVGDDQSDLTAPKSPVEKTLCQIWQDVLGLSAIGIHDNFFELGGDSILSIQIVSKAREAGLRLAPNQLFEQPTIAELAAVVNLSPAVRTTQAAVTGPVPLTPIQHWFFEQQMVASQHWHQAILLELPPSVGIVQVESAIATLWRHHDALRLHFLQETTKNSTGWRQINTDAENPPRPIQVDLASVATNEQSQLVAKYGSRLHAGLSRADGNALQAAHFLLGENRPSWLLISLHHLVVDGVSWQILQNDLRTLLSSSVQDTSLPDTSLPETVLPEKTTSFKAWAETLVRQAASRQSELAYWLAQLEPALPALPQDVSGIVSSTEGTAHTLTVELDAAHTQKLLKTVPAAYNTQINDMLLTALTQMLLPWINQSVGENNISLADGIRIDIEGHGRQQIVEDVDLSRTVGWFTAVYPMRLQLNDATDVGGSLKAIKEQLRHIPDKGIGYGMLRYLGDEVTRQLLAQFAPSEVLFNYLGQREAGESLLTSSAESHAELRHDGHTIRMIKDIDLGTLRSPDNGHSYLLEINAWVSDGQLHLNWTYDTQRYGADTIFSVANRYLRALKSIIAHCVVIAQSASVTRGGFTPSDFPGVAFTQSELDGFINQLKPGLGQDSVEAIYPLAPLQQAFLWHALQDSSQAGLLHMRGTLHGELDFARLRQAWAQVVGRHLALRTSVHWQAVQQPVQVATRQPALPWQQLDWRERENPQQALAEFLKADRALGFDFAQGPIMRLTLIRVGDRTTEMVWTCHHLMLDGWSGTLVVNQVLDAYEALQQGQSLATGREPNYQDYIHWLNKQDEDAAERFWRDRLKGFTAPTPLPVALKPPAPEAELGPEREVAQALPAEPLSLALSAEETGQLKDFLRSHRLTLNTLIQGTWALLLSLRTRQSDILFGATVSGRQAELAQVESIVGLLITVLPVRVTIPAEKTAAAWLQSLQVQQAETSRYAYAAPDQIQAWSECSGRLFNSLLVIENYPTRSESDDVSPGRTLRLENLKSGIISTYGLTIIVKPGSDSASNAADNGSGLTLFADAQGANPDSLRELLADFCALLMSVVSVPTSTIEKLLPSVNVRSLPKTSQRNGQPTPSSTRALSAVSNVVDSATNLPRTPRELELIKIWESVLGVSPLSTEASFFDLGGDSLLAVQLFNQMQQQLDCTLPLATLFQAPTVRQFAALMDEETSGNSQPSKLSKWSSLVPIQPNGSRRPFFFHGGSADALTWARFSKLLGADQPFYALQRPDLDGSDITYKSVEALAIACIDELRTVQPTGPYIIGGHCFGGAVAFEMAKQLQLQGETVRGLIEIDAYCPNALPYSTFGQLQEQLQLTYFLLRKSYYYHGGRKLMQLPKKIWQRLRPAAVLPNPSTLPTPEPNGVSLSENRSSSIPTLPQQTTHLPYEARYARAHQANIKAADVYYPGQSVEHYSGPLKIFRADVQILDWRYGHHLGWQTVTRDAVEITNIPGLFGNLFNQRSGPLLAKQVRAYLDTLQ